MDNKILTISIAAYNVDKYLEETLQSLITDRDTLEKMEIIVVNDGSKDNTSAIAQAFCKKFPKSFFLINKENGGYGSTINMSLEKARGKFFKLLDGDDWFTTENLEGFIKYLENCDSDMVIAPFYKVAMPEKSDELQDVHPDISSEPTLLHALKIQNDFLMHELAVKTDILRQINKPISEHCFYTDNEFTFYVLLSSKTISRYAYPIYRYRVGTDEQSVSLNGIRKHFRDTITVANSIFKANQEIEHTLSDAITLKLLKIFDILYGSFMLLEKPTKYKQELKNFDEIVRINYPDLYEMSNSFKKIKVLRKSHFVGYGLICKYVLARHQ